MNSARFGPSRAYAWFTVLALVAAACTPTASSSPSPSATGGSPPPTTAASEEPGEPVEIEWYVGLGTGENEEQIPREQAVVDAFNAEHPNIKLVMTVVDNDEAATTLATRIGAGDVPDIIGPIGIRTLQTFGDQLLDIGPYITESGVDLSEIEPELVEAYNVDGKQIGIPMAVYSSFFYYNRTLFEEAELPEPPHAVGEQWNGKDWTWDTVRELALQLTVDTNGNNATSPDFDPENIDIYGLDSQFTGNDARAWSTVFGGSGSAVADDGTTAQWPDNWREGLEFFYNGIHEDHIIPDQAAATAMGDGNTFQSGRIAMDVVHQWYTCCIVPATGEPPVTDWDIAVLPVGPDGNITSKLHADTIGIMNATENPDEAFEALFYLTQSEELTSTWGAMPAIESHRPAFFEGLSEQFAPLEIDWNVSTLMLEYPDNPNHEAFMPNFDEADSANKDLGSKLWSTPGLDVQAEIDDHVEVLQGLFDQG